MWINWGDYNDPQLDREINARRMKDFRGIEASTKFIDESKPDPDSDSVSWLHPSITGPLYTEFEALMSGSIPKSEHVRRKPLTKQQRNVILELADHRCKDCGSNKALDIHHKNENPSDNSLSNLDVVCRDCHQVRHKKKVLKNED